MLQYIVIGVIFLLALSFLIRSVARQFRSSEECGGSCGCSGNKVEKAGPKL